MSCAKQEQCQHGESCTLGNDNSYEIATCSAFQPQDQTNEEWLCGLSTEEKAEWIADKSNEIISWILAEVDEHDGEYIDEDDYWQKKSDVVEWLKQPHTFE